MQDDCLSRLGINLNTREIERDLRTNGIIMLKVFVPVKIIASKIEVTFEKLYFLCIMNGRWCLSGATSILVGGAYCVYFRWWYP